jgi:hypothetical protein
VGFHVEPSLKLQVIGEGTPDGSASDWKASNPMSALLPWGCKCKIGRAGLIKGDPKFCEVNDLFSFYK